MFTSEDLKQRLDFIRLDAQAIDVLKSFSGIIEDKLPSILTSFYEHISKYPDVSRFFNDKAHMNSAASKQVDHWKLILTGKFDSHYVDSVRRVGRVHARIGLEPQYYLSGYTFVVNQILQELMLSLSSKKGLNRKDMDRYAAAQDTFLRAAMLDMDLAIHFFNEARAEEAKQKMLEMAKHFESSVGAITEVVASASTELESTARSMTGIADQTHEESVSVAASIAQATEGVSSAARSVEDMGKAVDEIAKQMSQASSLAGRSVETANSASNTIRTLSASADKVGEVISLISDIAEQTNLLALNATIESARAGEAGKGFAVVASEVKSLANQTARATEDISGQIKQMLDITETAVKAIDDIHAAISELNTVSLSINSSVEEQAISTREIARNTSEAAAGNQSVSDAIQRVASYADNTKTANREVVSSSGELGRVASELERQVAQFLEHIRAA